MTSHHIIKASMPMGLLFTLLVYFRVQDSDWLCLFVSPDESRVYYIHLSYLCHCCRMDFLSALHTPQSFSNPGRISLVPRSRYQWILGAMQFHLWPLWGQMCFSCVHSGDLSFQPIFFIYTPNMRWTEVQTPIIFWQLWFHLWPQGGKIYLFLVYTVNLRVFK